MQKDIVNGLLFVIGIFGFISGAFIASTVIFAAAAILSNIEFKRPMHASA
jgi:CheY-specific phosphatase CheX